jgi:transposase
MPNIRQESLFDIQVLFNLEPTHRFNSTLSGIEIHPILDVVMKTSRFRPEKLLNYSAIIYLLIIRIAERTPFIKNLAKRLSIEIRVKVDCEFLVSDETIAIDATHVEARNRFPYKLDKVEKEPQKRGRKKKEEREQWLIEKAEIEANLLVYEKKIEYQLDIPIKDLRSSVPAQAKWGIMKNCEGEKRIMVRIQMSSGSWDEEPILVMLILWV